MDNFYKTKVEFTPKSLKLLIYSSFYPNPKRIKAEYQQFEKVPFRA